jgi:transposase
VVPSPTPQLWEVPTMSESMALVGLDVHRAQSVAAVLDPFSGELRVERLRGEPAVVVPLFLERLERPVRAVYEAGLAAARGLDVRVVAPGSIPRAPGDRVKTDRRDANRLVRLFAAGELSFAFVPSEADERFRDLVRCVDDARKDLMRARHRLSKFLLRRGLRLPGRQWTQPHERWLGQPASMTRSRRRCSSTTAARSTRSSIAAGR